MQIVFPCGGPYIISARLGYVCNLSWQQILEEVSFCVIYIYIVSLFSYADWFPCIPGSAAGQQPLNSLFATVGS